MDMKSLNDNAVLCYVRHGYAWFTTCPLEKQWGDDWDDAPYQFNAEDPYASMRDVPEYELFCVRFESPLVTPEEFGYQIGLSVRQINAEVAPWLQTPAYETDDRHIIWAGTTFAEFKYILKKAGGVILVPWEY